MTCRLYICAVGNDNVRRAAERYLSVVGIIVKAHGDAARITPEIENLKAELFGHAPPEHTIILHPREIQRKETPFKVLRQEATNSEWERRLLGLIEGLPYVAVVATIDKLEHINRYAAWHFSPYHYCVRTVLERYVLWLNRHGLRGDVAAEAKFKHLDKHLKTSFADAFASGTDNVPPSTFQRSLTSRELKFKNKRANTCGFQLLAMIADPSHQAMMAKFTGEPMRVGFNAQIVEVLTRYHYARNPKTGVVNGWGQKLLP